MIDDFKKLTSGDWRTVKPGLSHVFLRWLSNSPEMLERCALVNVYSFTISENMKYGWLSLIVSMAKTKWVTYPKKMNPDPQKELIKKALNKLYGWSAREVMLNFTVVEKLFMNKKGIEEIAKKAGWENADRKVFELDPITVEKPKPIVHNTLDMW